MIESIMIWIWLAVFIIALIVEACTLDLVSIWFSIGALVGICLAAGNIPFYIEIIVVLLVSIVSLVFTRPVVKKLLKNQIRNTNADSFIGEKVTLLKEISKDKCGEIKINDIYYTAISKSNEKAHIEAGKTVKIIAIKGNKIIVEEVKGE